MWLRRMACLAFLTAGICFTAPLPKKTSGDVSQITSAGSNQERIVKTLANNQLLAFASSQQSELQTEEKVKSIEGQFEYVVVKDGQRYVISPVPTALRERAGKIDKIRVLGNVDEEVHTIKPDKIQIHLEGRWENLKSPDLDEKVICDDKNCRNCDVKCGGTCKCSKRKK